ncbi:MAG TPA: Wzz/FepE/Etk N-terminal domain-containing protein [Silvibacterium sp.]|nr:Wzz/FepE/Etk N-terminal domain-containing protein [Silvibacterium sp.]
MVNLETTELRGSRASAASHGTERSNNVDFLDVSLVFAGSWRSILLVAVIATIVGGLVSVLLPPTYTATAIIIPPQQQQSFASAMEGELGSLSGIAGGGSAASIFKNPGELYVGILKSRTIADQLIEANHLRSVYHAKTMIDARAKLKRKSSFEAAKDGLILIAVTDHNPQRASDLANGYVDSLYRMNSTLAITQAAQRRVFFDQELVREKVALDHAENDLATTQRKTGVIQLTGQAQEIIVSIAQLRAQIASREVQIQALKTFATDQNPDIIRAQQEIDSLRDQLEKLQNSQAKLSPGDIQVPSGRVPEVALEYTRKVREVRYHEALYNLLTKQYEAARIDEAKSAPLIQVIDRAVPPDKTSGPPRLLIALGSGLLGIFAACAWLLIRNGYRRMRDVPENAIRLQELRQKFRHSG